MVERIIVSTLVNGGVYALLASGFSLIYGVAHLVNLAHTAFYMLAAYGIYLLAIRAGLGIVPSIAVTLVVVVLFGVLSYRLLIDRVRHHAGAVLLITIAVAMIAQEVLLFIFKGHYLTVPPLVEGFRVILGVRVLNQHLLTLGAVVVVIIVLRLLLTKTKLGISVRATAQDSEVATLMGINVPRTLMVTMGLATCLAVVAGIVVSPLTTINPHMWTPPLVMVMVIVIFGGLGSIKGSIIGAFIIALIQAMVINLLPGGAFLNTVFALLVMVIVLVVRPAGLFGTIFEEERL